MVAACHLPFCLAQPYSWEVVQEGTEPFLFGNPGLSHSVRDFTERMLELFEDVLSRPSYDRSENRTARERGK